MSKVMKPAEVMKYYDETLKSMDLYPGEWLTLLHSRRATCKDPEANLMWEAGIKRCRIVIAKQFAKQQRK